MTLFLAPSVRRALAGRPFVLSCAFLMPGLAIGLLAGGCGNEAAGTGAQATASAVPGGTTQAPTTTQPALAQLSPTQDGAPAADPHAGHAHATSQVQPAEARPVAARAAVPAASRTLEALPQGGRLEIDKGEHDFGSAVEGEVLKHTFALKSVGEADLIITSAKPSCGCTVSMLEVHAAGGDWQLYGFGDPVAPGTEMRLTAELDTKGKRSHVSSKINLYCNDPRDTITLGLQANLDTYFNFAPASIDFGELSVADVAERSFEVSNKRPGAFKLALEDKPLPEGLALDLQAVDPDGEGRAERWKVVATLGPGAREGQMGFPIVLTSSEEVSGAKPGPDGAVPHHGVNVIATARVRGLISWEPMYLSFGLVRPGQVVARTFLVQSFDPTFSFPAGLASRFVGPTDNQPNFKWAEHFSVTTRPSADGRGIEVELTLNGLPEEADGSFQGRLILETGHSAKPEVPVLFSGVCRAGPR